MQSDSLTLIIIVICILMSAYFSATETAFSSLNRIRIKNMAEKGNKKAALVLRLSDNYDGLLSTILIGNNIVNIASASLATLLFVRMMGEEAGASVSTAVTTVVVLIFGEVSPKSIAKESPERFAMFSAPVLNCFMIVLTPLNFLFKQWKKLLSKIFKAEEDRTITEEELLTIVEEAEQEGGIDAQESTLIRSAIEFSELEAMDVLTPRIDVTGVPVEATKEDIASVFARTGYSRLPVYEESMDNIIGIIYQKDFHNYVFHTDKDIAVIMRPPIFIAKTKKIGELLKELQKRKSHIAVVLDEFGGTIGIVTMEDILEEIVGEIWDEHDKVVYEIEKLSDSEYMVLGSANAEKLLELLHMEEELEVLTVSGWVMDRLGRIPAAGDSFDYKKLHVTVLSMAGKRVDKVQVILKEDDR